jgi:hypothetical protein
VDSVGGADENGDLVVCSATGREEDCAVDTHCNDHLRANCEALAKGEPNDRSSIFELSEL